MAVIRINDLKVRALIGAYSWERVNKQELILNITIEYDASRACRTDKLKDALNYETVAARAVKTARGSRHVLLEKLASRLLAGIMSDKRVDAAWVRVDKTHALPDARCVSFELSAACPRTRGGAKR
ncbi:MAG: dihydroneopterin aldolase [Candidatus Omnitrophica bacterium]|nr:dihydroneopterin aldolase [Candidatus Omnitrophota bacterium]MDE2009375.1 dihydroneopterin aldolase [Candidatus Omnitrophota bacterium]MDE2214159.1 dihydroneopterin aldolase [Candidatus Omnitrophota bacterium]MDE2231196.1 dihydroneopterin aldolase [Candidatus Omnitrophota bacterium]